MNHPWNRQSEKDISSSYYFMNRSLFVVWIRVLRIPIFYPVHVLAPATIDRARLVTTDDVSYTSGHDDLCACHTRRTDAIHNHLHVAHVLSDDLQGID